MHRYLTCHDPAAAKHVGAALGHAKCATVGLELLAADLYAALELLAAGHTVGRTQAIRSLQHGHQLAQVLALLFGTACARISQEPLTKETP